MQMFRRNIQLRDVEHILNTGIAIQNYPNDKPFPSYLLLGFQDGRPIHNVLAINEKDFTCIIVTAYIPDPTIWDSDYKLKIN
jgi:hypothetical protein